MFFLRNVLNFLKNSDQSWKIFLLREKNDCGTENASLKFLRCSNEEGELKEEKGGADFWKNKDPCWKLMDCPEFIHKDSLAYLHPERPCWEVAYTKCEILICIRKDCKYCKVYCLYHNVTDPSTSKV